MRGNQQTRCNGNPRRPCSRGRTQKEGCMRRTVRAAAALLALVAALHNPAHAEELTVATPDGVRSAILLPAARPRAPTVIVLHGALISAEATVSWYGFGEAV